MSPTIYLVFKVVLCVLFVDKCGVHFNSGVPNCDGFRDQGIPLTKKTERMRCSVLET